MQVAIPFFTFAAINFYAFHNFFGWWGVLPPLLFMVGGIIEGNAQHAAVHVTPIQHCCPLSVPRRLNRCSLRQLRHVVTKSMHTAAGVVAETMFDQRWHGFAVVLLNAGLIAEYVLFLGKTG